MSSASSFNQFPIVHHANSPLTLNLNTVLIVGLIQFLVQIILSRKKLSSFFYGSFQPRPLARSSTNSEPLAKKPSHQSVSRTDMKIVLTSLGMVSTEDEAACNRLPSGLDADDLFAMFEERNPSKDEVKAAFDVFDGNRDGFIDAKDLQNVLCGLGLKEGLDMENCRRMIRVFDEDGDERMDFEEFVKFLENSFC